MTEEEVRSGWPSRTPDERFDSIDGYIRERIDGLQDWLPAYSLVTDDTIAGAAQLGGAAFAMSTGVFQDATANRAMDLAKMIVGSLLNLAQKQYAEDKKAEKEYYKERRKWEAKIADLLAKQSKPKAKDPRSIEHEYYKPYWEIEKYTGSGAG